MILVGTMGEKIFSCWLDVNLRGWQSFNFCSSLVTMRNHICENRTNTGEVDSTDKEKNYALGFTPELNCILYIVTRANIIPDFSNTNQLAYFYCT